MEEGCPLRAAKGYDEAEAAFKASVEANENALALTALAKIAAARGAGETEGAAYMKRALALGGEYARLVIDAARFLGTYGTPQDVDEVIAAAVKAHPAYLENGRIALLCIQNLVKQSRLEEAEALLLHIPEIADMHEGEASATTVWVDLYRAKTAAADGRDPADIPAEEILEKYPLPKEIDFRMTGYQVH